MRRSGAHAVSVEDLVGLAVRRLLVVVAALAVVAVGGMLLAAQAVSRVTSEVTPAAEAHQEVLQDLTDLESAVGAWARSGDAAALEDYREAAARLPGHERDVADFAASEPDLQPLLASELEAGQRWLDQYADPRAAAPGGPETFDPARFALGQDLFSRYRAEHAVTARAFDDLTAQARTRAWWLVGATIAATLLLTALAGLVVTRARRDLRRDLSRPLQDLETVVQDMAAGRLEVRAGDAGTREVRAVAAALNELADAQARARAVEAHIHDELRELDTAREDFVSNVSHELRTPLTTISGYLEMVAEEFEDAMGPRHQRMLEATTRNVARLRLLIDDLLTLSRAEARSTSLEQGDVRLLLRDVLTDVAITAAGRDLRVEVEEPEDPLWVLMDRAMLARAFLNVIGNAVKFSRPGSVVTVAASAHEAMVRVTVSDSGIGIPADEVDQLGGRFFRASNAVDNEIAGTGLGLRIVQTIVDKHGGDVRITSEEGRGTTVVVRLPERSARQGIGTPGPTLAQ